MKSKLYKSVKLYLALVILLSLFVACTSSYTEEPVPPVELSIFPAVVTDQSGRTIEIEKIPEKIVSLAPSNTEIIYALNLEDSLVGVTRYCDYPEAAQSKQKIGEFSNINIEKIVEIQPDLILATSMHRDEVVPQLERLGLTVLIFNPKDIATVLESIELIGSVTGRKKEASQLVTEMRNRVKLVTDKTDALPEIQKPRVFYILWHDPLQTVNSESRIHELIVKAGGINIARDLNGIYPTISLEVIILANPQLIIAGGGHGSGENLPLQFALNELRLNEIDARLNNRIYVIDSDLTNRPGPRIVDGLERFAELIHPELFK